MLLAVADMHFHTISSVISLHPSLQVYDSNRVSCHATTENRRDIQSKIFHKGTKEKCVIKTKLTDNQVPLFYRRRCNAEF